MWTFTGIRESLSNSSELWVNATSLSNTVKRWTSKRDKLKRWRGFQKDQQYTKETVWLEMDSFKTFFFLLKKGREVVIGGTRPKTLSIQRKPDFKFVSIDVKPSAGFKRKANPTEGGKCKNCHLLLEYG